MIKLQSVCKNFNLTTSKTNLFDFLTKLFRPKDDNLFFALKNIDLNIEEGGVYGVIGKNGSGKTTLLKVIAGILRENVGTVEVSSQPVYVSGFSNGINRNLTMLDNLYIIGTLNGLARSDIALKIEEIIEFSDLRDFVNVPLYKFSTGMISRFSFAAMIFTLPESPEILLLDEVIGAGADASFQEKISSKIRDYIQSSKLVLVVSHNTNYILDNCSNIIWLDKGEVKMIAGCEVVTDYLESLK